MEKEIADLTSHGYVRWNSFSDILAGLSDNESIGLMQHSNLPYPVYAKRITTFTRPNDTVMMVAYDIIKI